MALIPGKLNTHLFSFARFKSTSEYRTAKKTQLVCFHFHLIIRLRLFHVRLCIVMSGMLGSFNFYKFVYPLIQRIISIF
jgi:hypothetical protein